MGNGAPPFFVIGCPRSGTTLLRLMLDAHPHISCGPETHFLIEMRAIVDRHWRRVMLFGFTREYWLAKIAEFFDSFQREYAQARGKTRWADKTPRYTPHVEFLSELFPTCQFVHLIRDARDVVASHRKRWGYQAAMLCAARTWRQYVTVARDFGRSLPPDRYFELRYEDLVSEPETQLGQLLAFLEEPWSSNVLKYEQFSHDFADGQGRLRDARGKDPGQSVDARRIGQGRSELDPVLRAILHLRSGALMRELSYV